MIKVFIDGSANPKKQLASIGIIIIESGKQQQLGKKLDEYVDNHEAEFLALDFALDYLLHGQKQSELIICHSDSKMLVDAVNKKYSRKNEHAKHLNGILEKLVRFPQFYLKWVPDKENKGADNVARKAMNQKL